MFMFMRNKKKFGIMTLTCRTKVNNPVHNNVKNYVFSNVNLKILIEIKATIFNFDYLEAMKSCKINGSLK